MQRHSKENSKKAFLPTVLYFAFPGSHYLLTLGINQNGLDTCSLNWELQILSSLFHNQGCRFGLNSGQTCIFMTLQR